MNRLKYGNEKPIQIYSNKAKYAIRIKHIWYYRRCPHVYYKIIFCLSQLAWTIYIIDVIISKLIETDQFLSRPNCMTLFPFKQSLCIYIVVEIFITQNTRTICNYITYPDKHNIISFISNCNSLHINIRIWL